MRETDRITKKLNGVFTICELILLRAMVFGCFVFEIVRFVHWLVGDGR